MGTKDPFTTWKYRIFQVGLFLLFVVTFGDYLFQKIWPVVAPLFGQEP